MVFAFSISIEVARAGGPRNPFDVAQGRHTEYTKKLTSWRTERCFVEKWPREILEHRLIPLPGRLGHLRRSFVEPRRRPSRQADEEENR